MKIILMVVPPPNHHALFFILFISGDAFGFGSKLPNTSRPQKYLGGLFLCTLNVLFVGQPWSWSRDCLFVGYHALTTCLIFRHSRLILGAFYAGACYFCTSNTTFARAVEGSIHKPGSLCGHSKPKLMLSQTVRQSRSLNRGFLCVFEKTIIFFKKYAFLNKKLLVSYALSMTPHMTGRGVKKIKGRLLKKFN